MKFRIHVEPPGEAQSGDVGFDAEQVAAGPQQPTGVAQDRAGGRSVVYQPSARAAATACPASSTPTTVPTVRCGWPERLGKRPGRIPGPRLRHR